LFSFLVFFCIVLLSATATERIKWWWWWWSTRLGQKNVLLEVEGCEIDSDKVSTAKAAQKRQHRVTKPAFYHELKLQLFATICYGLYWWLEIKRW